MVWAAATSISTSAAALATSPTTSQRLRCISDFFPATPSPFYNSYPLIGERASFEEVTESGNLSWFAGRHRRPRPALLSLETS